MSFLDVHIIRAEKTFTTSVSSKPYTVYTHFDSFLPVTYQSGTVYTLAYKGFQRCSSWTKLHHELLFLKQIFLKSDYPDNFVNKYFKRFIDNMLVVKKINS